MMCTELANKKICHYFAGMIVVLELSMRWNTFLAGDT